MGEKVVSRIRSRREQLRRIALVYKDELNLRIVSELYTRPMGPTRFHKEFGGGSQSKAYRHFKELERDGWLRQVEVRGPDSKRRGGIEHIYRATELPFFDAETWTLLPYSVRLSFSWNTFMANASVLREGLENSLAGCLSSDLSCQVLQLDLDGWIRLINALDSRFESIFAEQEDAKIRTAARKGGELFRVRVFLAGFECAGETRQNAVELALYEATQKPSYIERLSPVFGDDLCMQIVARSNQSEITVKQIHRECQDGASEGAVRHRFGRLTDLGWLSIVRALRRRGAVENVYVAAVPAMLDTRPWANAPTALHKTKAWRNFELLSRSVNEAIRAGTFDLRDDRHLTCSIVALDREGWEKVVADLESLSTVIREVTEDAEKKVRAGGPILTMNVACAADAMPLPQVAG